MIRSVREVELRLVVDDELLGRQRLAQLALEGHRAARGDVHLGGEEAVGVAARLLGPVHGELGVLEAASSTARPSAGATVMPTLALMWTSRLRITNGYGEGLAQPAAPARPHRPGA